MPSRPTPGFGSYDRDPVTPEELEFLRWIDRYKTTERRPFPSWREVLAVVKAMGYRIVMPPGTLPKLADFNPPHYDRQPCNMMPSVVARRWRKNQ